MIIIIKKNGQIVTDDGNPIEGKALEGAYMLLADAQDGDSIVYDGTNHMWKAGQGGGSFDPDITDPQDGDTLVYNAAQQKWVNGAGSSGGGVLVVHADETVTLDKTWQEISDATASSVVILVWGTPEDEMSIYYLTLMYSEDGEYVVGFTSSFDVGTINFNTNSTNGYPVLQNGNGD